VDERETGFFRTAKSYILDCWTLSLAWGWINVLDSDNDFVGICN